MRSTLANEHEERGANLAFRRSNVNERSHFVSGVNNEGHGRVMCDRKKYKLLTIGGVVEEGRDGRQSYKSATRWRCMYLRIELVSSRSALPRHEATHVKESVTLRALCPPYEILCRAKRERDKERTTCQCLVGIRTGGTLVSTSTALRPAI